MGFLATNFGFLEKKLFNNKFFDSQCLYNIIYKLQSATLLEIYNK